MCRHVSGVPIFLATRLLSPTPTTEPVQHPGNRPQKTCLLDFPRLASQKWLSKLLGGSDSHPCHPNHGVCEALHQKKQQRFGLGDAMLLENRVQTATSLVEGHGKHLINVIGQTPCNSRYCEDLYLEPKASKKVALERGIAEKNNVLFWSKERRTQASPSPYNIHMRKEAVNLGRQDYARICRRWTP